MEERKYRMGKGKWERDIKEVMIGNQYFYQVSKRKQKRTRLCKTL